MGDVIRLKPYLKARRKAAKEAAAAANRVQFGRTKGERTATEATRRKAAAELDGKRLEAGEPEDR